MFLESVILGIFANVELASQNPTMTPLVVSAQGDTSVQLEGSQKIAAQVKDRDTIPSKDCGCVLFKTVVVFLFKKLTC